MDGEGKRRPEWGILTVYGKIELVPLNDWGERVKADPVQAPSVWVEHERQMHDRLSRTGEVIR